MKKGRWRGATGPEPTSKRNRRGDRPDFVTTDGVSRAWERAQTHARRSDVDVASDIHACAPSARRWQTLARAPDQGFCRIAVIGAALRRTRSIEAARCASHECHD